VGFIITNNFSVSDFSVFWDIFKLNKETCVGSRNVTNTLKKASYFVAKTSFPKWLQARVFHEGHVFHFFSSDWVNDRIGVVFLGSLVVSHGDGHIGSLHVAKVPLVTSSEEKDFVSASAPSEVRADSSLV
jgi:hypothetical protein